MTIQVQPSGGSPAAATSPQLAQIRSDLSVYSRAETDAIATSASARGNHTGTQLASTISDFVEAAQDVVGGMVVAAGGTYNDGAGTATFPGGGGGGGSGTVDTTIIDGSANAVAGNAVFDALALKANITNQALVNPSFTGPIGVGGISVTVPNAMGGSNAVDTSKPLNIKVVAIDLTLTFTAQPAQYAKFGLRLTNSSGATRTVTLPASCFSIALQATVASFDMPNNSQAEIEFEWDGLKYLMQGDPVTISAKSLSTTFADGANDTQVMTIHAAHAGLIFQSVTQCDSGTATYTVKINNVAVTATPNAVSTSKDSRVVSALNTFVLGDKITVTRSANASCVNGSITILYAPVAP